MKSDKKYFAFISYKSEDEEWAKWLQNEFENYHLPTAIYEREELKDVELPKDFRPIFRDNDELKAGNLSEQIHKALLQSINLVVVCSPNAAMSPKWINDEINYFVFREGNERQEVINENIGHVFPFIVEGEPHGEKGKQCFPPALEDLKPERLGGDVNKEGGREKAFIRILAGMLHKKVEFDMLWNRYERDKIEEERREREQKEKLQTAVGRLVGEKAMKLIEDGDSYLAAAVILEMYNSGIGLITPEVDGVLRRVLLNNKGVLRNENLNADGYKKIECIVAHPDGNKVASIANNEITIWDTYRGTIIDRIALKDSGSDTGPRKLFYIGNSDKLVRTFKRGFEIIGTNSKWRIEDIQIEGKPIRHIFKDVIISSDESFAVAGTQYASLSFHKPTIYLIKLNNEGNIGKRLPSKVIIDQDNIPSFNRNDLESISLSPNDDLLAFALKGGEVYLWSIKGEKQIYPPLQFTNVLFVRFSHDGKYLLIVTNDGYVEVRNMKDFYDIKYFPCNTDKIFSAHFSQNDKQIFICGTSYDNSKYEPTVYIYNIEDGNVEKRSSIKNKEKITFVNYNEITKQIISASEDGLIQIWGEDKRTTIKDRSFPHITHIEYGNSDTIILASEEKLPVQHIKRNKEDETTFTVITASRNLYLVNAINLEQEDIIPISELSRLNRLNVCPEDESIYISDGKCKPFVIKKLNNKWEIVPTNSKFSLNGKYIDTIFVKGKNDSNIIYNLHYKKDNSILIMSETEEQIGIIPNVLCPDQWAVDSKGKYLVVRVVGGFLTVFSLEKTSDGLCKEIKQLGKSSGGDSLFTPNGKYYISVVNYQNISIWDTETWTMVSSFILSTNDKNPKMDISLNSKYLIVGSVSWIYILDIPSGIIVDSIEVKEYVKSVKFNPDGKSFAVLLNDGTLLIYRWLWVDELIDNANNRFSERKLSEKEKKHFLF